MWIVILAFLVVITVYTLGREDGKSMNTKKLEFLLGTRSRHNEDSGKDK